MKIRRKDLVAASALGLLQRRQIAPLFLFLLQRDVHAKRLALAAQARTTQRNSFHGLLFYMAAFSAIATTVLFAVLLTTRAPSATGSGAMFLFSALYLLCAGGIVAWFKQQGYGRAIRMSSALVLTSVPLVLFAIKQMSV